LRPGTAKSDAQVVACHPVCSVQVRVWFHPEHADHTVTEAGTGQAALALLQVRSLDPPPTPRHDQVADPPHEPARLPELVPVVQAKLVVLLQTPFTEQIALALLQVRSLVPPLAPRQDQVDDPPQEPARLPELVPVVQAN
jgi:hypothetical protein